jgi:hypothetical protein
MVHRGRAAIVDPLPQGGALGGRGSAANAGHTISPGSRSMVRKPRRLRLGAAAEPACLIVM